MFILFYALPMMVATQMRPGREEGVVIAGQEEGPETMPSRSKGRKGGRGRGNHLARR